MKRKRIIAFIGILICILATLCISRDLKGSKKYINNIDNNTFISDKDGKLYENDKYRAVGDYIKVDRKKLYYLSLVNSGGGATFFYNTVLGAYYDKDRRFLSGINLSRNEQIGARRIHGRYLLTIPENACYFRISVNDSDSNLGWIIEKNRSGPKREPYKTIVWFGDSIVGNFLDETSVTEQLSVYTGALVYNAGFGGCRMSIHATGWDSCSMYNMAEYVKTSDFSKLTSEINDGWKGMPSYFPLTARILSREVDFDNVDIIIISYGTNDYRSGEIPLENKDNKYDIECVCGALRYSIREIKSRCPNARIIVTSPTYRFFSNDKFEFIDDSNTHDWGGGNLKEYSYAYSRVCREQNVEFCDLYNESRINELTRDLYFSDNDDTHPNAEGRKEIAKVLAEHIGY